MCQSVKPPDQVFCLRWGPDVIMDAAPGPPAALPCFDTSTVSATEVAGQIAAWVRARLPTAQAPGHPASA